MRPDIPARYQRASEILEDCWPRATRLGAAQRPRPTARPMRPGHQARLKGPPGNASAALLLALRKPLHARSDRCPFCGEASSKICSW